MKKLATLAVPGDERADHPALLKGGTMRKLIAVLTLCTALVTACGGYQSPGSGGGGGSTAAPAPTY